MSAYVWIDDEKKKALVLAISIMKGNTHHDISRGKAIHLIQEVLGEVEQSENVKLNSIFVIQ